jgi:anthranilate synthase component 1
LIYPDKQEFERLAQQANVVPVTKQIYSDTKTPIGIFMRFANEEHSFLLESVEGGEKWARYSFIGRNPYMTFSSEGNEITIIKGGKTRKKKGNPFDELKEIFAGFRYAHTKGLPRLSGGAVGYFGYDTVRHIEKLPDELPDDLQVPDCYLMFCDEIIAYDHLKQEVIVIVNAHIGRNAKGVYDTVVQRLEKICTEIEAEPVAAARNETVVSDGQFESNFTKEEYCAAVQKAKQYILDGDIFQVVLSQRLCMNTNVHPFDVYRVLRTLNPSPYLYYLRLPDCVIVGSSPELLVRVEDDVVETCPIAGTRPRGKTPAEDEQLANDLLSDEKELAEHTMLVDLSRNDIGKVSKFGSVVVENPMHIEKYSHVMHIVSNVKGEKRDELDAFDVLTSALPAGTLSGAPKVRAMEIIDELEKSKRGIYGGSIGYIGFDGNIDTCITIRTMVFHDGKAYLQAGAGIVADSVPETEYEETLSKAKALIKALEKAGEMR